jgi:hypothetical protein
VRVRSKIAYFPLKYHFYLPLPGEEDHGDDQQQQSSGVSDGLGTGECGGHATVPGQLQDPCNQQECKNCNQHHEEILLSIEILSAMNVDSLLVNINVNHVERMCMIPLSIRFDLIFLLFIAYGDTMEIESGHVFYHSAIHISGQIFLCNIQTHSSIHLSTTLTTTVHTEHLHL